MKNTIWTRARYKFRSDSTENWEKENSILLAGEHGVVTDSNIPHQREKIGDGITPWNELGWYHGPEGPIPVKGQDYFTPDDIKKIVDDVLSNLINVSEVGQ